MRAIIVRELGGPQVLKIDVVDTPVPGPRQVLIAVRYIGVNFTDVRNRIGDGLGKVPFIPGIEVSGSVVGVGPGAGRYTVGQAVAAFTRGSAYAEYVVVPEDLVFAIPKDRAEDPAMAGMLVTVPLAVTVIERAARVRRGETVVLHAAAGGVGCIVGQLLAPMDGVRLWGTVGDIAKAAYARAHGYSEVMTYEEFPQRVRSLTDGAGVDVILDPVGGPVQASSLDLLAPFGRLVSYSNISRAPQDLPDAEWMRAHCVGYVGLSNGYLMGRAPELVRQTLARAVDLVTSGAVTIDVTQVLPLEQAADIHRAFEDRAAVGKFVLAV